MNPKGTVKLETKRLLLRRFTLDDVIPMFNNWASDQKVTAHLTWEPHKTHEDTQKIIKSWLSSYNSLNFYHWCIEAKSEQTPIGSVGVVELDMNSESANIGYCLSSNWWNKGIMTEALEEVLKFLSNVVQLRSIFGYCNKQNMRSNKVLQKFGVRAITDKHCSEMNDYFIIGP